MKGWLDLAAVIASAAAAILWLCSALIRTPKSFLVDVIATFQPDAEFPGSESVGSGFGSSRDLTALGEALARQSFLSALAAGAAALATACQAASLMLSH